MASLLSCYAVVLGILASSTEASYLQSPAQGPNEIYTSGNTDRMNGGGRGGRGGGGSGGMFRSNGGGDPIADLENAIPGGGVPGQDYPILASVPETGFTCEGQIPGYYADTDQQAGCQVFHICQDGGQQDSFLCPNGTVFNQQYFVCDWWFNFDCSTAEQFYALNADIGKTNGNGNGYGGGNGNVFGGSSSGSGTSSGLRRANGNGGVAGNGNGGYRSNGGIAGNGNGGYRSNGGVAGNGNGAYRGNGGVTGNGNSGYRSNGGVAGNGNAGYSGNGIGRVPQTPSSLYQSPV
ncbi:loricrin-like [Palaemon carinicauda]|uniref:loricrin-like n=1 Tax=Palaemon carinicauda TaxID=392227 RepID=UPI0035B6687A